jgi:glycosyltransferase involved in cell wall biosynthesis
VTDEGRAAQSELEALRREVSELRDELRSQRRLQRLIAESHSAREDFMSAQQHDPSDPLQARLAAAESALRLVQLSRPYRVGQKARRAVDAVKRLGRSVTRAAAAQPRLSDRVEVVREPLRFPLGAGRAIVFFVPWLTYGGGGDQFVRDLAGALVGDGRTVLIVVTQGCPPGMTDATAAAMEITPYVFDLAASYDSDEWLTVCERMVSCFDRPVIINVGSTWVYRHLRPLRAAAGDGVTVIDQLFNHVGHIADDVAAGESVDLTVVAHDGLRRLLVDHYGVRRPVATVHVGLRSLGEPPRRKHPSQLPLIAWLGRLSAEKRALWFVDLARELDGRARFILAGTGPELPALVRSARGIESLDVMGFVDDSVAFLDTVDLLVVTSEIEGISVVAMEAIARGVPVVATDVGGMADLVQQGVNGELVQPDDISELVVVVRRLVENPSELRELQERVRRVGLPERFTLSAMTDRYRSLAA